jgi:8-oxo-dGTP diphosphatase
MEICVKIWQNETMEQQNRPKVGIGVMILKEGKFLLGKRKGSHGEGEYAFPGGHLEYMESFESCARRETREEAGIEIKNIRFQFLANVTKYAPKHYVHIGLLADWSSGEPEFLESEKLESWGWYDLDNLPEPLFDFCRMAIDSQKIGRNYYDQ